MKRRISHKKESRKNILSGIDVVILAGGLGTRFASVMADTPKILAPLDGTPLLDILVKKLSDFGVGRIILCIGHLKEQVMAYVRKAALNDERFRLIEFSEEENPLGTGGALKNAEPLIRGEHFVVMNGDTLYEIDLAAFYRSHIRKEGTLSIATKSSDRSDAGRICVGSGERILSFEEKSGNKAFPISAGIYVMHRQAFSHMPDGVFSLEYDFFPEFVKRFSCHAFSVKGDAIDIGTPDRYNLANKRQVS